MMAGKRACLSKGIVHESEEGVIALDMDLDPGPSDWVAQGKLLKFCESKVS